MNQGDLVKRVNSWHEWQKNNSWMKIEEENEIGIVTGRCIRSNRVIVLWGYAGLSYEDKEDLKLLCDDR